jgi:AcrR family transcriptional regulator
MRRKHQQLNNGTKDKIIDAALTLFLENGYEKTTVRMITEKSDTVTGSFYHYFSSKEDLVEASVDRFLQRYAERFANIANDETKSFMEQLHLLLNEFTDSTRFYYSKLSCNKLHWTVEYALHKKTLLSIMPSVQHMIEKALNDGRAKNILNMDTQMLSAVVLHGIEAILHAKQFDTLDEVQVSQIKKNAEDYAKLMLGIMDTAKISDCPVIFQHIDDNYGGKSDETY